MPRQIIIVVMLLSGLFTEAQDINGIWKGKIVMAPSGCFPVYNIELQLQVAGTRITGTAYHFSDSLNYIKENFEGNYNRDSNQVIIKEIGIVTFKIREDCVPCIKTYTLTYHRGGGNVVTEEQLRGSWATPSGKAIDGKTICEPGTIVLTRFEKSSFKPELKLPPSLTKRKAELVKEIKVDTGSIKIDFYDNGQIDGDTISVYVNNMPVVSNRMLKTQPISVSIKIDNIRTMQEVIMVGENLGSIPPNTALMIVTAGNKRYQLYLTSDEQKNAMVRFLYEKPVMASKNN
ncbi:MAG TPA: hypothetical protein PLO70_14740 [Chitinophagaceae bacterium]|nr:hypothetical protein [Chitinophagaceae bacterium]HQV84996.1 hypothetical protein [Chitinophagaceae bacterium]HQZ75774.1 hypothetical protein [Chitinophagaceae bacterium]